ncbi:branched-chain amino acid ABC transporter permease [Mangrovicoccus sp. HB161399]|uniref:branched-chain amino acid ABC transporter permease n=1 Tax=Mangrovicoccus sp. HB161399 TaxID=2720392 RepID=UPI00155833B8|nr:branched-chain amino acid ABC transporter permease [Mangrovicoccus sp. HB161399]
MSIDVLAFSLLNGTLYGMLLFLLASGLTLIFSMMGVLNFAHASFFMLGAYLGFEFSQGLGFFPALILAPLCVGLIGAGVERFGLRRVHRFGHLGELLFTFGLAFVIEEAVQMIWGRSPQAYPVPAALDFTAFEIFGTGYPAFRLFMLAVSAAIFAGLALLLNRTRVGLIVRASLTHPEMVSMLGHNVPLVFMSVFGAGSALAALGGVIAGPILVTQPSMAAGLGPILFVIVVVGGLGSLGGAFAASLIVGFIQTFAVAIDFSVADAFGLIGVTAPPAALGALLRDVWNVSVSQVGPVIPYLLLVAMLIFRPMGLAGKRA